MSDLGALSSYDFEILCQDLFRAELGYTFESFMAGPDGGVDLRHLGSRNSDRPSIVIQCKHYLNSDYSKLKSKMVSQYDQAKALAVDRYLLATTVSMNPNRKASLFQLLPGLFDGEEDILGREDIEALLRKHPDVEKAHFKLWLTSAAVLDRVLNNEILSQTEGCLERLSDQARVFVSNESVAVARGKLDEDHVCIITGPPGVGKTTLADILLMAHVSDGFEPVIISSDIGEANQMYKTGVKQIFVYDDFLGRTSSIEKLGKNEDSRLMDLARRVSKSPTKRFILTTREHIFQQARSDYDLLSTHEIQLAKFALDVGYYTRANKAEILYNHFYFSGLSDEHLECIVSTRVYKKLVASPNFNPRVIETAIDVALQSEVAAEDLAQYLLEKFENPSDLWRHLMTNGISLMQRAFLAMITLRDGSAKLQDLKLFHLSFSIVDERTFEEEIRGIEGTAINLLGSGAETRAVLANPGVEDGVIEHILPQSGVIQILCRGKVTFQEIVRLWNLANDSNTKGSIRRLGGKLAPRASHTDRAASSFQLSVDFYLTDLLISAKDSFGDISRFGTYTYEDKFRHFLAMAEYSSRNSSLVELADGLHTELLTRWRTGEGDICGAWKLFSHLSTMKQSLLPGQTVRDICDAAANFITSSEASCAEDFRAQYELAIARESGSSFLSEATGLQSAEEVQDSFLEFMDLESSRILSQRIIDIDEVRSAVYDWSEVTDDIGISSPAIDELYDILSEDDDEDSAGSDHESRQPAVDLSQGSNMERMFASLTDR